MSAGKGSETIPNGSPGAASAGLWFRGEPAMPHFRLLFCMGTLLIPPVAAGGDASEPRPSPARYRLVELCIKHPRLTR